MTKKRIGVTAMQGVSAHLVRIDKTGKQWDDTVVIDIGPGLNVYHTDHGDGKVIGVEENNDRYYAVVSFKGDKNRKYRYPVPDDFFNGTLKVKFVKLHTDSKS